ncbi:unnamed protein product [Rhizophagus irregularis]|nr:unnamed protein product [Rhizophagus irregularis]
MTKQVKPTLVSIILYEALFLLSGFFSTLGQQFLYYQGAASNWFEFTYQYAQLIWVWQLLGFYFCLDGMDLVKNNDDINMASMTKDYQLLPGTEEETSIDAQNIINTNQPKEVVDHKIIFAAACLDVIANVRFNNWILLCWKWDVPNALGINQNKELTTPPPPSSSTGTTMPHSYHMSNTMFGMLLTSFATFGYACVYVVSDQILTARAPNTLPPSPKKVCFLVGTYGSLISFIYIIFYTIPNWNIFNNTRDGKKNATFK